MDVIPTFSIIIPTFNRAYILSKAIQSVLDQTITTDLEIIVVDDGSIDNTQQIIKRFNDNRIKYIYQPNQGPSAARNLGLRQSTKEWIVYLDSDNTFYPNYFEVITSIIQNTPTVLYAMVRAFKTYELYENGQLTKIKADRDNQLSQVTVNDLFDQKAFFDVNGFVHKKTLRDEVRWDENLHRLEDWDFFLQIGEQFPDNFEYISQPLIDYRMRFGTDGILSNTSYSQWAKAYEYVYQKHKNDKMLHGQTWYPERVNYYKQKQIDYIAGKVPPPHLRIFLRD